MVDPATLPARIESCVDAVEEATRDFGELSQQSAVAEAKWKGAHAAAMVRLAENAVTTKLSQAKMEAYAMQRTGDLYQAHLLTRAAAESAKQAIYSHRARLDALRTLNANFRAVS